MPKPTLFFLYAIAIPIFILLGINYCCAFPSSTAQELASEPSLPPYIYLKKADSLENAGLFNQSILYIQKAQTIYQKRKEWEAYINCFFLLSKKQLQKGQISESMLSIQTGMDTSKQYLYEGHPVYGNLFQQMGEVYLVDFQLKKSAFYIEKAIQLFSCEEDWTNYAWNKSILGIIAFYAEDYNEMECALGDALKIAQTLESKTMSWR